MVALISEVITLKKFTMRMPDELHEKLRWLSYSKRKSMHEIVLEILEQALKDVKLPEEAGK